jgi:hypothetical protein
LKIAWKHLIRDIPFSCQGKSNIFFFHTKQVLIFYTYFYHLFLWNLYGQIFFASFGSKMWEKKPISPYPKDKWSLQRSKSFHIYCLYIWQKFTMCNVTSHIQLKWFFRIRLCWNMDMRNSFSLSPWNNWTVHEASNVWKTIIFLFYACFVCLFDLFEATCICKKTKFWNKNSWKC